MFKGLITILSIYIALFAYNASAQSFTERNRFKVSDSGVQLRSHRKLGLGIQVAGISGLAGANLELNFTPLTSFVGGFGLGEGFQSFSLGLKRVLAGDQFLPYIAGGYSKWYSTQTDSSLYESTPSLLVERFLSSKEKQSGQFAENLLYGTLGIQFLRLGGSWTGFSLSAEVIALIDVDDLVIASTGGISMGYYF